MAEEDTPMELIKDDVDEVLKETSPFKAEEEPPMELMKNDIDEVPKQSATEDKPMELKSNIAEVPKQSSFMAKADKPRELKDNIAEVPKQSAAEEKPMELKSNIAEVPKQSSFMAKEDKPRELKDNIAEVPKQSATEDKPMELKNNIAEIDAFEPATKKGKFAAADESLAQNTESGTNVDWSNLPPELLILLAQKLSSVKDFASFGSVCKGCMAATTALKDDDTHPVPPKLPCLMLAEREGDEETRGFFNLTTGQVRQIEVPEIAGRFCLGVNNRGWLFTLGVDGEVSLFNPFSKDKVHLPSLWSFSPELISVYDKFSPQKTIGVFVKKVSLSEHPKHKDCIVMAICGRCAELAFAKPGDRTWTKVETVNQYEFEDVVYYQGHFYAIDSGGHVVVCDIADKEKSIAKIIADPWRQNTLAVQNYLVEASGDLLLISQQRVLAAVDEGYFDDEDEDEDDDLDYITEMFSVVRIKSSAAAEDGVSLGDTSAFIGANTSISKSTQGGPLQRNSIYYTECNWHPGDEEFYARRGGLDMGIYNLEDGTIKQHYNGEESRSYLTPPLWLL